MMKEVGRGGEARLMGLAGSVVHRETADRRPRGEVFFHLSHPDGRVEEAHRNNLIVLDFGILVATLLAAGSTGARGITMLAVGTGATGALLSPDAPDERQRRLRAEICRKPFSSVVFRNAAGAVSSVPTNVVDFTTTFNESEAVGPWNEMALLRTISNNPTVLNPVPASFPTYDPTVDTSSYDLPANYLTFPVMSKPSGSVMSLTWRFTL